MNYYVYIYLDPLHETETEILGVVYQNTPLYVGKGKDNRCFDHLKKTNNKIFENKISKWKKNNTDPIVIKIVENIPEGEAWLIETQLIKQIGRRDLGLGPLLNLTDGGEGPAGRIPWNKGKQGVQVSWNKGITGKDSHLYGTKFSEEHKLKISEALKNKEKSEDHRKKISNSLKGNIPWNKGVTGVIKASDEARQKMSESRKGLNTWSKGSTKSEETKKKIGKANKGKILSDETKQKMSEAKKEYWRKKREGSDK